MQSSPREGLFDIYISRTLGHESFGVLEYFALWQALAPSINTALSRLLAPGRLIPMRCVFPPLKKT
jgi:hypothetical protein